LWDEASRRDFNKTLVKGRQMEVSTDLVRIVAPHFVAGVEVNGSGYVVNWPPILHWTGGKKWAPVEAYFKRKGYRIQWIYDSQLEERR
jgi:hypothetical protein